MPSELLKRRAVKKATDLPLWAEAKIAQARVERMKPIEERFNVKRKNFSITSNEIGELSLTEKRKLWHLLFGRAMPPVLAYDEEQLQSLLFLRYLSECCKAQKYPVEKACGSCWTAKKLDEVFKPWLTRKAIAKKEKEIMAAKKKTAKKKGGKKGGINTRGFGDSKRPSLGAFLAGLFAKNLAAKKTDEQLVAAVHKAYPESSSYNEGRLRGDRSRFTRGVLSGQSKTPAKELVQFDKKGNKIEKGHRLAGAAAAAKAKAGKKGKGGKVVKTKKKTAKKKSAVRRKK